MGQKQDMEKELGYLCVDGFIKGMVDARVLTTAFEIGLIDALLQKRPAPPEALARDIRCPKNGLDMLLELLATNNVIARTNGTIRLTAEFKEALDYRDLLLAKLDFAHIAAHDFIEYFSQLVADPQGFMQRASMFRLFSYGRCFDASRENLELAQRWVRITTMLTRFEAGVCFKHHEFRNYRRMLDIGGNSGEFALQACRRHQWLKATVFDLPLVCNIGQAHVSGEPEASRIRFIKGDALSDDLPGDFDLVTLKSVLHDWPDQETQLLLHKAAGAVRPGGTLLIFERGPLDIAKTGLPYSLIPILLFAHTFRGPDMYRKSLAAWGFREIDITWIDLETPFFLITAVKPA